MPQIEISYEALDEIVVGALKDHIECVEINQNRLQEMIDNGETLQDFQKIDYFDNGEIIDAMNKVLKYFGG